jgi:hypothetical protein
VVAGHDGRGHADAVVPLPPTLVLGTYAANAAIWLAALVSDLCGAVRVRRSAFVRQAGFSRGYLHCHRTPVFRSNVACSARAVTATILRFSKLVRVAAIQWRNQP